MASFTGNGFGCACGREQCDDNCPTYRNYMQMPSYPRMNGGQCTDVSCPYRTSFGYCYYTACIKPMDCTYTLDEVQRPSTARTNADRIRAMTDEELAMLLGAPTIVLPPWCNMNYDCPYIDQDPARCDLCALDWLKQEVEDA